MNMNFKEIAKVIGVAAVKGGWSLIVIVLTGILLNLIYVLFAIPEISQMPKLLEGGLGTAASFGIVLVFVLIFPIVYFFVGKKYSIKRAIRHVLSKGKETIVVYAIGRVVEKLKQEIPDYTSISKQEIKDFVLKYIQKINELPYYQRLIFNFVFAKIDINGIATTIIDNCPDVFSIDSVAETAKTYINEYIDDNFFNPSLGGFWLLVLIDTGVFVALKMLV